MRRLLALIHLSVLALTFGTGAAIAQECDGDEPDSLQIKLDDALRKRKSPKDIGLSDTTLTC